MFSLKPREVSCLKQDLFRRLTAGAGRVNVLGQNKYVQRIARLWTVRAFIDDFTAEMVHLDKPVIRMADWLKDCIVVSCVMDTLPITALDRLRSVDAREVIDYFGLAWPWTCWCRRISVRKNAQNIRENAARYEQVYGLPVDDVPQQHFAKIVQFRLSMNPEYMRGSTLALDHRYFEDFLSRREAEVFVDGGGYDGQTSLQSAAWNGAHCRIHYFEPAPAMMTVSQRTLAGLQHVHFVQKGLSCRPDRLRFDADGGGPTSSLSPTRQSEIGVVRLDDEVQEPVTLVKLDIEGAEYDALEGAAEHIRSEMSTLAIYHDQWDFWRVPLRVLDVNGRYDLYVRHYSESIWQTVMFFVPRTDGRPERIVHSPDRRASTRKGDILR